jgi:hypothetical protein
MRIYTADTVGSQYDFANVVIDTKEREKSTHYAIAQPCGRTARGGERARRTSPPIAVSITQAFTRDVPNRASECAFGASGI